MMKNTIERPTPLDGIDVRSVGVRWFHPGGFVIDRPTGVQEYSFVQWLTPSVIKINGETLQERPGGCIIYRPKQTQWYGSDIFTPFGNNWMHFLGPVVEPLIEEYSLPVNRPFYLKDDTFIEPALRFLLKESMSKKPGWRVLLSIHTCAFFIEMHRSLSQEEEIKPQSARSLELLEKFESFREHLKDHCTEHWTLGRMANELHLSPSRFSKLYRDFFDAKPIDDLIHMRISLAEYYLRASHMPVNYIANLCGFSDSYYFSRLFKAKTGQTASAFRLAERA